MSLVWEDPRDDYVPANQEQVGAVDMNRIGTDLLYLKGDHSWQVPSLTNSWVNFDAAHTPASFRRIGDWVYLRGLLTGGARDTDMFTLPTGYTPLYIYTFCPVVGQTPVPAGSDLQRIDVNPAGNVHCMYQPISSSDYVSLDGIVFSVDS